MKIGILTFYRVGNFGANLQAVSTYYYLKNAGHEPLFLNYTSRWTERQMSDVSKVSPQPHEPLTFVDNVIKEQTYKLYNSDEVVDAIHHLDIDAVIIGSDAVVQHHPLLDRIKRGRRKPFYISHPAPERMFPNPFWGVGFSSEIPTAMMSVSSQNSRYSLFTKKVRKEMLDALRPMKYISVRDTWTQGMMLSIGVPQNVTVTPDPVFAFNYNAGQLVSSKDIILNKYSLPNHYVLVSLHSQSLKEDVLSNLKRLFREDGKECVAFPMPAGIKFKHDFDYEINIPLSPIDWYALIKYADAYIGSNMHPIIVSLHNFVPCFSIDHWGTRNIFGHATNNGSSKVQHIMGVYGLQNYVRPIENGICNVSAEEIVEHINKFPQNKVVRISDNQLQSYLEMMNNILISLKD